MLTPIKVGQTWYVKTKPTAGCPLVSLRVKEITEETVVLTGLKTSARYKRDEVEFVELVP